MTLPYSPVACNGCSKRSIDVYRAVTGRINYKHTQIRPDDGRDTREEMLAALATHFGLD